MAADLWFDPFDVETADLCAGGPRDDLDDVDLDRYGRCPDPLPPEKLVHYPMPPRDGEELVDWWRRVAQRTEAKWLMWEHGGADGLVPEHVIETPEEAEGYVTFTSQDALDIAYLESEGFSSTAIGRFFNDGGHRGREARRTLRGVSPVRAIGLYGLALQAAGVAQRDVRKALMRMMPELKEFTIQSWLSGRALPVSNHTRKAA